MDGRNGGRDGERWRKGGGERTGRMLNRGEGEGEAGRRTGGGGERGLKCREGGWEAGSSDLSNHADLSSAQ